MPSPFPPARLVGRETELAALRTLLARALDGRPVLALLHGPSGAGATALVDALLAEGEELEVRRVSGLAWERTEAFELLRRLGLSVPSGVDGPGIPEAAEIVADQVRGWLETQPLPVVVVLRDAQVADPESLLTLSSALQRIREGRLLVIVTAHDTADPDDAQAVAALRQAHRDTTIDLSGLDVTAVRELAASMGATLDPPTAQRLRRHTDGIPRLVVEVLRGHDPSEWGSPDVPIPPAPSALLSARHVLAGVGPSARAVAEALSVLSPWPPLGDVGRLAKVEDVLPAVDEARAVGLLRVRGQHPLRVEFSSPMTRAAVLDTVGLARRQELHRRAAALARDEGEALRQRVLATPAPNDDLGEELDAFGRRCAARGAWGQAGEAWVGASRLLTDPDRAGRALVAGVDALVGDGDLGRAGAFIRELDRLPHSPERDAVLAYHAILRGHAHEAEHLLSRAWADCHADEGAADGDTVAMICHRRALHALAAWDSPALVTWSQRARANHPETSPAVVEARTLEGLGLAGMGRLDDARAAYAAISGQVLEGAQAQRATMGSGWLHLAQDDVAQAARELELACPTEAWHGSSRVSLWAHGWLARAQFAMGDWTAAMVTVERAQPILDSTGQDLIGPLLHWTGAEISALRGEWDRAARHVEAAVSARSDYVVMLAPAAMAQASVAMTRADYAGVLRALAPLATGEHGPGLDAPGFWPWQDLYAIALIAVGLVDEADQFLRPLEAAASEQGHRSTRARLGAARGRLHGVAGDVGSARQSFDEALGLVADLPLPYLRTRLLFASGETLRRAGKRREADELLRQAREGYIRLGAAAYVRRCDQELKAGGLVPPGSRGPGASAGQADSASAVSQLTPQERAVADLVAAGLTNKEVAAQMFISVKTVQYHLTRIYSRLGIRSRSELAAAYVPRAGE